MTSHSKSALLALLLGALQFLLFAGCATDHGEGSTSSAEDLRSPAQVTVKASVTPGAATANQEVTVHLSVTSTRSVTADVTLRVLNPDGSQGYTGRWQSQNLVANTALTLDEAILVEPSDPVGSYSVGALVQRTGSTSVFFDKNGLASFSVSASTPPVPTTPAQTTITMGETHLLSGVDSGNGNLLVGQQASLGQAATMQSMSFNVVTASGRLVLGIYDATGASGGPGALKAQTPSFAPVVGWNTQNLTTPVALPAGTYWLAYLPSSSALAFEIDSTTGSYWAAPYTFAAMPGSFPTAGAYGGTAHWALYASGSSSSGSSSADSGSSTSGSSSCTGLTPIPASTPTLYISPTGSDSAAGTAAAPMLSLGAAANKLPTGGTIVVTAGTYGVQTLAATGTASNPLVIQADKGTTPVFDGSSVATNGPVIQLTSASHVAFVGLEVRNGYTTIGAYGVVSDVTIQSCSLHDTNQPIVQFAGDTIRIEGNTMYNGVLANVNADSCGGTSCSSCLATAPNFSNPSSPWTTNVTIRKNTVHDCWGEGINAFYGSGVVIADNIVERAFNVGIYNDNSHNVVIERNFVTMKAGMLYGGGSGTGTGILLGVEPYTQWGLANVPDHDISIVNNVVVASGIGWWTSSNTSPNNSYANVSVRHNTVVSPGAAIGFSAVAATAVVPTGCSIIDNVLSEAPFWSGLENPAAFTLGGNAWLNEPVPSFGGATDVSETVTVPTLTQATDAEPLASVVGRGIASGVTQDFSCTARSATTPTRGAFEQ
jgi:hypothetical protein